MPKVKSKSKPRQTRMDLFLPSSPKKSPSQVKKNSRNDGNGLRQATIMSLTRVVSVDHLVRCRTMLLDEKTEKVVIISTLQELSEKIPSKEILKNTRIGHAIRKLLKSEDEEISEAAKVIYDKWKSFFVEQASQSAIDVKCSTTTENCRRSARKHLAIALELKENHPRVLTFEREAFHLCKTKTLHQYKRIMRCIILKCKTDQDLKDTVAENKKKTSEIVKMFE